MPMPLRQESGFVAAGVWLVALLVGASRSSYTFFGRMSSLASLHLYAEC
jgi:hypothetical protein